MMRRAGRISGFRSRGVIFRGFVPETPLRSQAHPVQSAGDGRCGLLRCVGALPRHPRLRSPVPRGACCSQGPTLHPTLETASTNVPETRSQHSAAKHISAQCIPASATVRVLSALAPLCPPLLRPRHGRGHRGSNHRAISASDTVLEGLMITADTGGAFRAIEFYIVHLK